MAELSAADIAGAARALMLAGRWRLAAELLDRAVPADEGERAVLAVADAEAAVDQDFWERTGGGSTALDRATAAVGRDQGVLAFDLEFIRLKHDYASELFGAGDGEPSWGPDGRDRVVAERLSSRAEALRDGAPDASRRANAAFYAGVIAENLRGDSAAGRACFQEALRCGEEAGDGLIVSYALRHLGYQEAEHGDRARARDMLQRSMELRQSAGCVPLVLAQQFALAELAMNTGDVAWARTAADLVRTWARALGDTWLGPAAESLLSGSAGSAG
ncbi:MAG TPA: hypothetical protein VF070_20305 [Streptosporangiaceae bacterium]